LTAEARSLPRGKISMKHQYLVRFAYALALFLLTGALAAQDVNQDLKSGKKQVKTVRILPPEANLVKSGMKGAEPLAAESRTMETGLSSVLTQSLSQKGFSVLPSAFTAEALDKDSDLKYALSDVQTRYDKMQVLLAKKPKGIRSGRFSLGDEVANLNPAGDAGALVFVRADGYVPTAGLKTFVVVTGMGFARNYAKLDISVADAQTGTILYFAKANVYGNFLGNPDSMKEKIYNSLSGFWTRYTSKR
jgi:hypothetical protein